MSIMVISAAAESTQQTQSPEVVPAQCESCGFTEECTPSYIRRVRDRHKGHWVCGLCSEAVKDEVLRSPTRISTEEAVRRHISFCRTFLLSREKEEVGEGEDQEHPISVMGRILRRSLDNCNCDMNSTPRRAVRTRSSGDLPGIEPETKGSAKFVRSGSRF